ncbi:MAG: ATPase, T2SS/T4P/T4SS family [Mobiluncus porci]|uniref:CpaF family protein n=1 Tax=Mobiluncus porci TaxID=2652278 RepID=UPI0023F449AD|nr:ATPase, T2SS/T4P/T4SS family [Mobiluncus porci]MDD7540754.1 ATPase, T2SS/T4P/T4SS family [Mobiluncus porci]MDY5748316.1 ATPase, T2SS/T4P/T4SS family [Mobiluncus porci]
MTYGALQSLLDDPEVEEIWLNSPSQVFCSRNGRAELTNLLLTDKEVGALVERMLRPSGRHLDYANPCVDATLETGERLHVVIPPVTSSWSINIRKHHAKARKVSDLVKLNLMPPGLAEFLSESVRIGLNIVVSGPTQAGKTTTIRALCGEIPTEQRVVTCEEVLELNLKSADCVAMQTRHASLEGHGEITLRDLVKESLRMRPDRLIIGEVRGAESLDMLIALNCGIPGMSTIHANTARAAIMKLTTLPLLAGENVTDAFVIPTVANAIDLIIQLRGTWQGTRAVSEILALDGQIENGRVKGTPLYRLQDAPPEAPDGEPRPQTPAELPGFDFEAAFGSRARHLAKLLEKSHD